MEVKIVRFKDGVKVMIVNDDIKNHYLLAPDEAIKIGRLTIGAECVCEEINITYEEWRERHG